MQLDRLAAVDLLDLFAGDRIQRLDAARVQHGHLAEQIVGRAGSRRDFCSSPARAGWQAAQRPRQHQPDQSACRFDSSSHLLAVVSHRLLLVKNLAGNDPA